MVSDIPFPVLQGILKLIKTGPFIPDFRANVKFSCVLLGCLYPYTSFWIECRHSRSARGMHSAHMRLQVPTLGEYPFTGGACNGRAWSLMFLNLVPLQVISPAELSFTNRAFPFKFFFCLLKSNEFTIKPFCKIPLKHWIKVSLVPLQQNI